MIFLFEVYEISINIFNGQNMSFRLGKQYSNIDDEKR